MTSSSSNSTPSFFHHGQRVYFSIVLWDCLALVATGIDRLIKTSRSFSVASANSGASVRIRSRVFLCFVSYAAVLQIFQTKKEGAPPSRFPLSQVTPFPMLALQFYGRMINLIEEAIQIKANLKK